MITETGNPTLEDAHSAISWKAIFAGTTASLAVTMILVAFGMGVGFSIISPWSDQGVSATTFTVSAAIYLFCVSMLSSTVGGYLAGRLRSRWATVNEHERYFRDSAHGFVVWALAAVVGATVMSGAVTHIIAGASSGLAATAVQGSPSEVYVDQLLRTTPAQGNANAAPATAQQTTSPTAGNQTAAPLQGGQISMAPRQNVGDRGEITRIIAPSMVKGGAVSDADKKYLASIVAARSGVSQGDAEARVDYVINQAKQAADKARKSAALFGLWLAAAMLAGALSAALAAIEGGNLRNREWYLEGTHTRVVPAE